MRDVDLFPDLPAQKAPTELRADRHVLRQCPKCHGKGRRRISAFGTGYCAERVTWKCHDCDGAGWTMHKKRRKQAARA